jgi:hypothetical protein
MAYYVVQEIRAFSSVLMVIGLGACKPSAIPEPTSPAELDSELRRVLGVGIPMDAVNVTGNVMTVMTHVADVEFTCDQPAFEAFWDSSLKLSAENSGAEVILDPESTDFDFDSSWTAGGGTQFCTIKASTTPSGSIRVVIRSTHE